MAKEEETLGSVYERVQKAHNALDRIVKRAESPTTPSTPPENKAEQISAEIQKMTEEATVMKEQLGWDMGSFPKTKKVKKTYRDVDLSVPQYTVPDEGAQKTVLAKLNALMTRKAYYETKPTTPSEESTVELAPFIKDHRDKLAVIRTEMEEMRKDKKHPYNHKQSRS